jgi:hypothetical protein
MIAFAEQGSSWDSAFNQRELHRQGDVGLPQSPAARARGGRDPGTRSSLLGYPATRYCPAAGIMGASIMPLAV